MKNYSKSFLFFALAASMTLVTSCGKDDSSDDPSNEPGTNPINPVTPNQKDAMSPLSQKEYLEKVALELMDMTPASDFKEIGDLADYINDTYIDNYDWDNVGDWAKDIFNATKTALGTKTTTSKSYEGYGWEDTYNYIYTNYKATLLASNFTGHFTANNGVWSLSQANDLQFIFKDKAGQECVLKLETKGSVKKVNLFNDDDWKDYDYESKYENNIYYYICNDYYDRIQYTIGVPEKTIISLTQGGKQVFSTTINVDMSSIANEEFDLSKNNLNASATIEFNNGYKFESSQCAYEANKKIATSFAMKKNDKSLIVAAFSSDLSGIPSCNVSAFSKDDFDIDNYNTEDTNAKNVFAKMDILGKVQIQGTLSDVHKYVDYLDEADEYESNELKFKSYINQANDLADINLFYNGSAVKQATVKLEPFIEESWYGESWWTTEPVIYFYDGSSYSTFDAFFNEKDFKKAVDAFKALSNKYAELVDEHIDW